MNAEGVIPLLVGESVYSYILCMTVKEDYVKTETGRSRSGERSARTQPKTIDIITEKSSTGKIGSYDIRTVDSDRFKAATKAANTALRHSKEK